MQGPSIAVAHLVTIDATMLQFKVQSCLCFASSGEEPFSMRTLVREHKSESKLSQLEMEKENQEELSLALTLEIVTSLEKI